MLAGAFTIGRSSECNLTLEDPRSSRVHALIHTTDDAVVLQDAGSSNGTWLNGTRLRRAHPLEDGDRIQIGDTQLSVHRVEQLSSPRARLSRDATMPLELVPALADPASEAPMPSGPLAELSQREFEVLCLVARGHTHKEIAELLNLSPKTVEGYRARVAEKLGLKTRAELVALALEHKLLG